MAGSSVAPGRIEFVILRTGRSPLAALHHTSLRRSGFRLQVGERLPGEDLHLSDYARFQAHHRTPNGVPRSQQIVGYKLSLLRSEEIAANINPSPRRSTSFSGQKPSTRVTRNSAALHIRFEAKPSGLSSARCTIPISDAIH